MSKTDFNNWCELPTKFGKFRMYDTHMEGIHLISYSDLSQLTSPVLLRVHSSCAASEVFGSLDCDCADQLHESMKLISENKSGMVIYLQQEGRGHGLSKKIRAVSLMQTQNLDTAEAFDSLSLEHDIRTYGTAVDILNALDVKSVRLISNNPRKASYLESNNIVVDAQVRVPTPIRVENKDYLHSKNNKLNHQILLCS